MSMRSSLARRPPAPQAGLIDMFLAMTRRLRATGPLPTSGSVQDVSRTIADGPPVARSQGVLALAFDLSNAGSLAPR